MILILAFWSFIGLLKDCSDLPPNSTSGVYKITPEQNLLQGFFVYCEVDSDNVPWTVCFLINSYTYKNIILTYVYSVYKRYEKRINIENRSKSKMSTTSCKLQVDTV